MKLGILQTGHAPEAMYDQTGDYHQLFERLLDGNGFSFETWSVVDGVPMPAADDADGWLITGSRHGAYEDHPWIAPLEALIRSIDDTGQPLVGICFGHQIIAQALGGRVEKFSGGWAVGRQVYDLGGRRIAVYAWHQDQVVEVPASATVLGGNAFARNAFLQYGTRIWTCQPHPEFDAAFVDGLLTHRAPGRVPQDLIDQARASLDQPTDRTAIADEIAQFFLKEPVS
ncbi:MAG: type 1 glutamine amidotransferase [Pseudomonadota bacterium]